MNYPAYVEFTIRMNVESEWEFETTRQRIKEAAQTTTDKLWGDEAAVQLLYRRREGVRPIESDPQEAPPFTFERNT